MKRHCNFKITVFILFAFCSVFLLKSNAQNTPKEIIKDKVPFAISPFGYFWGLDLNRVDLAYGLGLGLQIPLSKKTFLKYDLNITNLGYLNYTSYYTSYYPPYNTISYSNSEESIGIMTALPLCYTPNYKGYIEFGPTFIASESTKTGLLLGYGWGVRYVSAGVRIFTNFLGDDEGDYVTIAARLNFQIPFNIKQAISASDNSASNVSPANYLASPDVVANNLAKSNQGTVGVHLEKVDGGFKVIKLIPGSPAETSKQVFVNDKIIAVAQGEYGDFVSVKDKSMDEIIPLIKGSVGSTVRLQIVPHGKREDKPIKVSVVRSASSNNAIPIANTITTTGKVKTIAELELDKQEALKKEEYLLANSINEEIKKRKVEASGITNLSLKTSDELKAIKTEAVKKEDFVLALAIQEEEKRRLKPKLSAVATDQNKPIAINANATKTEDVEVGDDLIANDEIKKGVEARKAAMLPQPALTGDLAADAFILTAYGNYKQFYKLESILQFMRIEQKEIEDPMLGRVTVVKCYDANGQEISCAGISKEERKRIYNNSLAASGKILGNTAIMGLSGAKIIKDFKSNPITGAFALPSLVKTTKIISETSKSAKLTKANLEASLKCLDLLKE